MDKSYKLEIYIPETHLAEVKNAIFAAGAGTIGNYDSCCWQTNGSGQFRALDGSNPFLGQHGQVEEITEFKIELICAIDKIDPVIKALKESHPYETPAYQYWEVFV